MKLVLPAQSLTSQDIDPSVLVELFDTDAWTEAADMSGNKSLRKHIKEELEHILLGYPESRATSPNIMRRFDS